MDKDAEEGPKISVRLHGHIEGMARDKNGWVVLTLDMNGSVLEGHKSDESKPARLTGTFIVKSLIADQLCFGQKLHVLVTTDEFMGDYVGKELAKMKGAKERGERYPSLPPHRSDDTRGK